MKSEFSHLKLSTETEEFGRKLHVRIQAGCNCVLLGTYDPVTGRHGSYGSIDSTKVYDRFVEKGDLTDLRSFLPYRTYPKESPPGTPAIPNSWENWLMACDAAMAAFKAVLAESEGS